MILSIFPVLLVSASEPAAAVKPAATATPAPAKQSAAPSPAPAGTDASVEPEHIESTEKVRADFVVSFPVNIWVG